jgi:oligopeptide transport system ATP-binding protein
MASSESTAAPPALLVRGLNVTLQGEAGLIPLVRDVDLRVERGELVALVGESGSGKSVTARSIMGLPDPSLTVAACELRLSGTDLLTLSPRERRRLRGNRMSLVLQDSLSALNPVLSIGNQIVELLRTHRKMSRRQAYDRAVELLRAVGIPAPERRVKDYPHQFSGGMRQRILIAMAIALEPDLLIADEPTTALDVTIQAQILELIDELRHTMGMGIVLITHDLGVVNEVADRVTVMYAGRIVERGPTSDVLDRPAHPYTLALLRSVPQVDSEDAELTAIPGAPPTPGHLPTGCAFHPRCAFATDICRTVRPEMRDVLPHRQAACHRSEELTREHTH